LVSAALLVGAFLGVTAAAAVRWLNGGDFSLIPDVDSDGSDRKSFRASDAAELCTFQGAADTPHVQLEAKIEELVSALDQQHRQYNELMVKIQQEKQRISLDDQRGTVNQRILSFDPVENNLSVWLNDVRRELVKLRGDVKAASVSDRGFVDRTEIRLSRLIGQLEAAISKAHIDDPIAPESPILVHQFNVSSQGHVRSDHTPLVSCLAPPLTEAVRTLAHNQDRDMLTFGSQLLYMYVTNLVSNPNSPRYRKIFTSNDSFRKIENLSGARDLLRAVGFFQVQNYLEWIPQDHTYQASRSEMEQACLSLMGTAASALAVLKHAPTAITAQELSDKATNLISRSLDNASQPVPVLSPSRSITALDPSSEPLRSPTTGLIASPPATAEHVQTPDQFANDSPRRPFSSSQSRHC
jgi:hypothetical protein